MEEYANRWFVVLLFIIGDIKISPLARNDFKVNINIPLLYGFNLYYHQELIKTP